MYTFLSQSETSVRDHEMISINELAHELKAKGIAVNRVSELETKLVDYAREGMIPPGKEEFSSGERGMSSHYPRWVINFIQKVDDLEKKGYSKDRIISTLLHHTEDNPNTFDINKISRTGGGKVTGQSSAAQSRNLVRGTFGKIGN